MMMKKISPFASKSLLVMAFLALGSVACTNEKAAIVAAQSNAPALSPNVAAKNAIQAPAVTTDICSPEELAPFDRADGDAIDLDHDSLPRGLYLATVSAMLIEKKNENAPPSRVLIQEIAGGKGEIACAESADKLGQDFEVSLSGLVKFQMGDKTQGVGSGIVTRQFYFYQDKSGYGAVLSNPHLSGVQTKADDLKRLLRSNGQIVRLGEKSYLVKYVRDVDGVKARLLIRLELVPN